MALVTIPSVNGRLMRAFLRDAVFALPRVALIFGTLVALYWVTP